MSVAELFRTCSWHDVREALFRFDPSLVRGLRRLEVYRSVWDSLRASEPSRASGLTIVLNPLSDRGGRHVRVSARRNGRPAPPGAIGMGYQPWSAWLGSSVCESALSLVAPAGVAARILDEITLTGLPTPRQGAGIVAWPADTP